MRAGLPALLLTTLASAAHAELVTEFAPFLHDTDQPQVLALDGQIGPRTPFMFQRALQHFHGITTLDLASGGGNVYDALPLAYVLRRAGLRARIPAGKSCASACSYLFFAGVGRDAEGRLGIHSIAMPSNDLKAGQRALADIFAAFEDFGVPSAVHTTMMATPADAMHWYEPADLAALGLIGQVEAATSDAGLRASLRSQLELETSLPGWGGPPPGITPGQLAVVAQQRQTVAAAPDDIEARDVLAGYEAALGNYRAAHRHMTRAVALRGPGADIDDFVMLAYYLVAAAGGQVSSEAETAVRQALQRDRTSGIALYYLGLMYGQNGRAGVAFSIWRDLLERSQPSDPWFAPIRSQIDQVAQTAGIDSTLAAVQPAVPPATLPATPPAAPPASPPPTGASPSRAGPSPGDRATGGSTASSARAAGSYPEPSGLAIFAAALVEQTFSGTSWSGPVSQANAQTPYSMRLFLSGGFLKVDYPELSCGGYWELEDNSRDDVVVFIERLTYGQDGCLDGGQVTMQVGSGSGMRVQVNPPGGGAASATLRAN